MKKTSRDNGRRWGILSKGSSKNGGERSNPFVEQDILPASNHFSLPSLPDCFGNGGVL